MKRVILKGLGSMVRNKYSRAERVRMRGNSMKVVVRSRGRDGQTYEVKKR